MDVALEMARGGLDGDLAWQLTDLLQNRNEWWVPGKIVELRQRLADYWKVTLRIQAEPLLHADILGTTPREHLSLLNAFGSSRKQFIISL